MGQNKYINLFNFVTILLYNVTLLICQQDMDDGTLEDAVSFGNDLLFFMFRIIYLLQKNQFLFLFQFY